MQIDYSRNKYIDAYNEVVKFYKHALCREGSPKITFNEFRDNYSLYVVDITAQQDHIAAQTIQLDFKFRAGEDIVGQNYLAIALILTKRVIQISSDGKTQFDIVS